MDDWITPGHVVSIRVIMSGNKRVDPDTEAIRGSNAI